MSKRTLAAARRDGKDAGKAAASWVFDGNTNDETYRRVLQGIEDGDPQVLDSLSPPNLSGEWADSPTPQSLAEDYGIEDDDELDEVCTVWEDAASEAFWHEVERTARFHVGGGKRRRKNPPKVKTVKQAVAKLQAEARKAAERRGHRLGRWISRFKGTGADNECTECGADVRVLSRPAPNEIDIGGEAVALDCDPVNGRMERSFVKTVRVNPGVRQIGQTVRSYADAYEFLKGKNVRKLAHNTDVVRLNDGSIGVRFHNTYVVIYYAEGAVQLNSGGYRTVTTKQRINQLLAGTPFRVDQTNFEWRVRNTKTQKHGPFFDGMLLYPDGSLPVEGNGVTRNPPLVMVGNPPRKPLKLGAKMRTVPMRQKCEYFALCDNDATSKIKVPWGTVPICERCLAKYKRFGGEEYTGNPPHGGVVTSNNVHQLKYTHANDGKDYVHDFGRGVKMVALPNGAILLYHPSKPLWEDFG